MAKRPEWRHIVVLWSVRTETSIVVSFRFLHNCPDCFWSYHQGHEWQQVSCVTKATRVRVCEKLSLTHVKIPDNYVGSKLIGLGEPPVKSCKAVLAAGGGECWFATIFHLLVGKKSGKNSGF